MINATFSVADAATKEKIFSALNVDANQVKRDVRIIKDWAKQQAHLPNELEDNFVEICLIRTKFRIEEAKDRIDKYFGCKALNAEEMAKVKTMLPEEAKNIMMIVPLPELTDKLERVVVFKAMEKNIESVEDFNRCLKYGLCMTEYALRCDYNLTYRLIYDIQGIQHEPILKGVKLVTGSLIKPYLGAFYARLGGVEYMNPPTFVEVAFNTLKSKVVNKIFKEKIVDRISLHKDLDSLHTSINKKYLPVEYGGELSASLEELHEKWGTEMKNNLGVLEDLVSNFVSDESKRIGEMKFDHIFGASGTFKTLNFD